MKLDSVDSPHEWGWLSPNLRKPKISQDAKKLWSNGFGCGNWKAKIHGKLGFARPPSTFCTSLLLSRLHLSEHKELRLLFLLWSIFHSLKRSWNTMWWELLRSYQFFTHLSHAPGIQFCRNFLQDEATWPWFRATSLDQPIVKTSVLKPAALKSCGMLLYKYAGDLP